MAELDPTGRFELLELLGEGSYGCVYTARDVASRQVVALKVVPLEGDEAGADIQREIAILKQVSDQSPYVVSYSTSFVAARRLYIAMELCAGGSIADLIAECGITLDEEELAEVAAAALKALAFLHAQGIIHREWQRERRGAVWRARPGERLAARGLRLSSGSTATRGSRLRSGSRHARV